MEARRCTAFIHGVMGRGSILMVNPLSYFSLQPVLNNCGNKCHCVYYPVSGMVHIKDPLLLIRKGSPCSGGSGFPLSPSEWSFAICHISIILNTILFHRLVHQNRRRIG